MTTATPSIAQTLQSPHPSEWLKAALHSALRREPADAANDAEHLRYLIMQWACTASDAGPCAAQPVANADPRDAEALRSNAGATGAERPVPGT